MWRRIVSGFGAQDLSSQLIQSLFYHFKRFSVYLLILQKTLTYFPGILSCSWSNVSPACTMAIGVDMYPGSVKTNVRVNVKV